MKLINLIFNKKELSRASYYVISSLILGRGLSIIAQVLSLRIATTLMVPREMGIVSQLFSMVEFYQLSLISPILVFINRGLLEWVGSEYLKTNIIKFIKYIFIIAVFSMGMGWFLHIKLLLFSEVGTLWLILLIGIGIVGNGVNATAVSNLNILGYIHQFIIFSNLPSWLGLGLAVLLLSLFSRPEFWVLGQYLGILGVSTCIFILIKHIKAIPLKFETKGTTNIIFNASTVFTFAYPQVITLALWWTQSQSYRFVLDSVAGLKYVGLFSVAYSLCAMLISTFETLFNQYYGPIYLEAIKGKDKTEMVKAWNEYASAYVPGVILMGAFVIGGAPLLLKVFAGEKFQVVHAILLWPALTETLRAIGSSTINFMGIAIMNMRIIILPVALGATFALLGVYFFAQIDPLNGTGIALLLACVIGVLTVVVVTRRTLPIKWPLKRISLALFLALSMIIAFRIAILLTPQVSVFKAVIILALGGLYLLGTEYFMAREWIGIKK